MPKTYTDHVQEVNMNNVDDLAQIARMEAADRLKRARLDAGFKSARQAALRFGWKPSTYAAHENCQNEISVDAARRYARAFKVSAAWLMTGDDGAQTARTAPIVGYVGAGAETHFYGDGQNPADEVPLPADLPDGTVAVEVRGDSMYPIVDNSWLLFYDRQMGSVADEAVNTLAVVGLTDGRVLVKRLLKGRELGRFDLLSVNAPPMLDVEVIWAARISLIKPR